MTIVQNANICKWRERIEFIEKHLPHFRQLTMGSDNGPKDSCRVEMFTCLTQHIYANSCTELIDMGIEREKNIGMIS